MNVHASSSRSHTKTPKNATPTGKRPSSASEEQSQDAWVEQNAQNLLKAFSNWTRADGHKMFTRYKTLPLYTAKEGSDKNLQHTLGVIHKYYGPVDLRYEGCDTLARHWVSGWISLSKSRKSEEIVMICVDMGERLPGQAPALDRLQAEIEAGSDEEKSEGKDDENTGSDEEKDKGKDDDSVDSEDETNLAIADLDLTDQEIAEFEKGLHDENDQEKVDWDIVSGDGIDDGEWIKSNSAATMAKDAGLMLLDAFRKL